MTATESRIALEKKVADCDRRLNERAKDGSGPVIVGDARQAVKIERSGAQIELEKLAAK